MKIDIISLLAQSLGYYQALDDILNAWDISLITQDQVWMFNTLVVIVLIFGLVTNFTGSGDDDNEKKKKEKEERDRKRKKKIKYRSYKLTND